MRDVDEQDRDVGGRQSGSPGAATLVRGAHPAAARWLAVGGRAGASDGFLAGTFSILGIIAGGYAVQAGLRLRTEEEQLRAEPVLVTGIARLRWGEWT